jgi:uncharacterized protein (TIGR02099 family)
MLKSSWRWFYRIAALAVLLVGVVLVGAVLGLRYWLLPDIGQYRQDIAASISRAADTPVAIGTIAADWRGLRPHLILGEVRVSDRQGRPALFLSRVDTVLAWRSLLVGEIRLHSLEIDSPNLSVRRDGAGRIFVAGIEVNRPEGGGGFADWVLRQYRIVVRNAVIAWTDEQRGAPTLVLANVNVRLENGWNRHRVGLYAVPPATLAAPLDIRGDMRGKTVQDFAAWKGTLYASLDRADLAAWRTWLPVPADLRRGTGGVRIWLKFAGKQVRQVTADLNLNAVRTRFGSDLPELDLRSMVGRLGWEDLQPGFEVSTRGLSLAAQSGIVIPPADVLVRYVPAQVQKPAQGEFRANRINLAPLVALADYLPLSPEQRRELAAFFPRGDFRDLQAKWTGDWRAPERYSAKGGFVNLGLRAEGKRPGFSGLSGHLDATEQGGSLSLDSRGLSADLPGIFAAPIPLDSLTAQAGWKIRDHVVDLKLTNLSLANADAAGTIYGSYRSVPGTPGVVDLTGQFSRADARAVDRYLPLVVGQATRNWLKRAILAGHSGDARFLLKGNLADFPFPDDRKGVFEVTAKVAGGTLEYAPGWPRIDKIAVDLRFHGARMDIFASRGVTYGMKLAKVHAAIPNLLTSDELLEVDGEASGPTNDMLKFIASSPVNDMIAGFTEGMQASGNGNFALKLAIPLRHNKDTRVAGSYEFVNDRLVLDPAWPAMEQVNGRLEFTQDSVRIPGIGGRMLGGPVSVAGATLNDGSIRVNAQGRALADGLRAAVDSPLARYLNGYADWRAVIALRKKVADVVVDSNLVGLGSTLPYPFAKAASDPVPMRLERKMSDASQDSVSVDYGKILSARVLRRRTDGAFAVDRGVINLGGPAAAPTENGLWLTGDVGFVDFDQWRGVMGTAASGPPSGITGLNLKLGVMDAFGKRFNDLRINARQAAGAWQGNVQGRELAGDVNWRPEGQGKVVARLKYLAIPAAAPTKIGMPTEASTEQELPALDIVAEEFEAAQKKLGRLELDAIPQGEDWHIEKLRLSGPDSTLQMDGAWQAWRRRPHTQVNFQLDVRDIGQFLGRMGYPNTVRGGNAKLEGRLSWEGAPQNLNFATLSGNMKLQARNGQFLKVDPGVGKLLGILSLQALPRRITLDFRDVFSQGFAFDDISGTMKVKQGVVSSDDFSMGGPAAIVSMKGETSLVAETQDLQIHVIPVVGESVSTIGALLGGPVVGLTSIIVQKLLKEPLGRIVAYDYKVTGTWDNPKVEKLGRSSTQTNPLE